MPSRILVVEDDSNWSNKFQRILKGMGYEVDIAENADEATDLLEKSKYDLVLLDVCLKGDDITVDDQLFWEFLKKEYPDLPVIAVTGQQGLDAEEILRLPESIGFADFISKPRIYLPDFRRRIQDALGKAQDNKGIALDRGGGKVEEEAMTQPTVFISYSHRDEEWKDRLVTQLGVLQSHGLLDLWDDRRIGAGKDWEQEIQKAIATASVAILLVSANFLTSPFILGEEMPRLLERRDKEGLHIFPVIIKPSAWDKVGWLSRMQCRPKDGRPLSAGNEHQIDADLAAIATEVCDLLKL